MVRFNFVLVNLTSAILGISQNLILPTRTTAKHVSSHIRCYIHSFIQSNRHLACILPFSIVVPCVAVANCRPTSPQIMLNGMLSTLCNIRHHQNHPSISNRMMRYVWQIVTTNVFLCQNMKIRECVYLLSCSRN